jgi:hypothetical protein
MTTEVLFFFTGLCSFLDLLIEDLVLDLKLLEFNQMEDFHQLLLILQNLLLISKSVSDILRIVAPAHL